MKVVILAGGYGTLIRGLADRLVRLSLWVEDDIDNFDKRLPAFK